MKLTNTTDWPDWFLRRMMAWSCKEIGLPVREVRQAQFGKRRRGAFNGHARTSGLIRVVIGPNESFPTLPYLYPGRTSEAFLSPGYADAIEALIGVTAHELTHLRTYTQFRYKPMIRKLRRGIHSERPTRFEERRVIETFRANRDALLAEWSAPPAAKPRKPRPSRQEQNEAKARKLLAAWERKSKLARTKVAIYRRKVRRYDRIAAVRSH